MLDEGTPVTTAAPTRFGLEAKWKVLISVVFGIFMIILDTTVVNVAFQTLRREYGATLNDAQWIISVYVLSLGIVTPITGFLADRFGPKRIYTIGLALFAASSLACGLAPSLPILIIARAIQGIGGGLAQPLGPAFIYRTFPAKEQGMAFGFFGIALVLAPALGPILGGWFVDAELWRWIFFINIPIGIAGYFVSTLWLPVDTAQRKAKADPIGIVTASIGFGSVLYASSLVGNYGWNDAAVLTWYAVGAVSIIAWIIVELFVAEEPMLDLRLFRSPTFTMANLIGYVSVVALFGAEFLMPVYLQALRGYSAYQSGLTLLPLAIAAGFMTPLAGRFFDKIGPRPLITLGFTILVINTWQFTQIQATTSITTIMWLLALRGIALGLTVQTTFATALSSAPGPKIARASSLVNGTRFVVQSIGVAILATVLTSTLTAEVKSLQNQAEEVTTGPRVPFGLCETPGVAPEDNIPPAAAAKLKDLPADQAAPAKAAIRAQIQAACDQNVQGFEAAYLLTFYVGLCAIVFGLFLPGWPGKWEGRSEMQKKASVGH
jgi:EmrB/QacA subfamily drug resistance transporter